MFLDIENELVLYFLIKKDIFYSILFILLSVKPFE